MIIRFAETADFPSILELWNIAIRETEATFESIEKTLDGLTSLIEERRAKGHATFVAEDDGVVIGFSTYSQFRGGTGYTHTMEHTINVAAKARGRGAARALMRAVEDHAEEAGAHIIIAGVSSGNPDGVTFHARMGYTEIAHLREVGRKWGGWRDLILMQKVLSPSEGTL